MKKARVLLYGDTPCCNTGFGTVNRHLLKRLHATGRYEFVVLGVNHFDYYDQVEFPYTIYEAHENEEGDYLGIERFKKMIAEEEYDLLLTHTDLMIANNFVSTVRRLRTSKRFPWVAYSPLDADFVNPPLAQSLMEADYPVVYSNFGHKRCVKAVPGLEGRLRVAYLGCDTEGFYPLVEAARKEIREGPFGLDPGTFFVVNVNQNQHRKDLGRTMYAFKCWKQAWKRPAKLYLHCGPKTEVGGNLIEQAIALGLDLRNDVIFTHPDFDVFQGVSQEELNNIYNAADVIVSTTMGEGWGMSCTEAFATKTPVIMPRNSALEEIVGENEERGHLAASGNTASLWTICYGHSNLPRPLTDVNDFASKLERVYSGRDQAKAKAEAAYAWVQQLTWDHVAAKWDQLLQEALDALGG